MSLKSIGELNVVRAWVNPDHTLGTAFHLLLGFGLPALPVRDGARTIGVVDALALLGKRDTELVESHLQAPPLVVDPGESLRSVAVQIAKLGTDFAIVGDGEHFRGVVTATMLLQEMSRSWDPLTQLSWSDRLREWGIEMLRTGKEITIIFIDIDSFGRYNKVHGHIVGDRILSSFAHILNQSIDDQLDVLVRYGGDEFAIGTIRARSDAERLANLIQSRLSAVGAADQIDGVSASVGMFGGRRTIERDNVHYASTVDALINLASKDCLSRKGKPSAPIIAETLHDLSKSGQVVASARDVTIRVIKVAVDNGLAEVELAGPAGLVTGQAHFEQEEEQFSAVALATLDAAKMIAPSSHVALAEISILEPKPGVEQIEIGLLTAEAPTPYKGQADILNNIMDAIALATVRAYQAVP